MAAATKRRLWGAIVVLAALGLTFAVGPRAGSGITIPTIPLLTTTTAQPEPPSTTPTTQSEPPTTEPATESPPVTEFVPETPVPTDSVPPVDTNVTPSTRPPVRVPTSTPDLRRTVRATAISPAVVTGSYGIGFAAVVGFALILITLATRVHQGGTRMSDSHRTRLNLGIALLALAAIVGLVGYLKLSLEPDVNRQIPYLASAGMALVVLSAAGGALIVGEQLRADDRRIEELEVAVLALSSALTSSIEAPPRRDPEPVAAPVTPPKKRARSA